MKHLYDEEPEYIPYSNADKIIFYKLILKYMIKDMLNEEFHGFCQYIGEARHAFSAMESMLITRKLFYPHHSLEESPLPELLKYRPDVNVTSYGTPGGIFWFPLDIMGMQKRIDILNEILTQLRSDNGN